MLNTSEFQSKVQKCCN